MKSSLTIPRIVFYPGIIVFSIAFWYIGYSQGQNSPPIAFEVIELPACMPEPEAKASYM